MSNIRSTENALPNSKVFGEALSGCFDRIVEYSLRCAQYSGPMLYVAHVEKYVLYVAVHCFVRSFDNAIFFLGVRDRMVCDPRLLVRA